jgi:peptide methionine sulfoxide reductase msrA/msrB
MKFVIHVLKERWLLILLVGILGYLLMEMTGGWRVLNRQMKPKTAVPEGGKTQVAFFAGGCFWCAESDFDKLPGVIDVVSGYANGTVPNPTYDTYHDSGHIEAIKVVYDARVLSYEDLVRHLFDHVDFLDGGGQFVDRGPGYQSAIFYQSPGEESQAHLVADELNTSGVYTAPVATLIAPLTYFYPAEEYHQDYHEKSNLKYSYYRNASGRDDRISELCSLRSASTTLYQCGSVTEKAKRALDALSVTTHSMNDWKKFVKPSDTALQAQLNEQSYYVTQEQGTERPFENEYNANKEQGIYVDIVSGEPLYSSRAKYDSGTGWPSFFEPIKPDAVKVVTDWKLIYPRSEVRSVLADSHLGHVFEDGPQPTGKRYCMNSAAMRFIPMSEMEARGYAEYLDKL